jgi:hypothetical protein
MAEPTDRRSAPAEDVPAHIARNVEAIGSLHHREERQTSWHQHAVERLTAAVGRPAVLYGALVAVQRADHEGLATTREYIREAEAGRVSSGGVLRPLPGELWAGIETLETTRAPQELFVPGRLQSEKPALTRDFLRRPQRGANRVRVLIRRWIRSRCASGRGARHRSVPDRNRRSPVRAGRAPGLLRRRARVLHPGARLTATGTRTSGRRRAPSVTRRRRVQRLLASGLETVRRNPASPDSAPPTVGMRSARWGRGRITGAAAPDS